MLPQCYQTLGVEKKSFHTAFDSLYQNRSCGDFVANKGSRTRGKVRSKKQSKKTKQKVFKVSVENANLARFCLYPCVTDSFSL